jgi:hypothetical protein
MHDEGHNLFQVEASSITLARTLSHRDDPDTSRKAAKKMVKSGTLSRQERRVYETIKRYVRCYEDADFTTKTIAIRMTDYPYHKAYEICRRRFSGLFNKFKIVLTGEVRDGCRVWKLL